MSDPYDLLIIGGGINGCGIARDAAGRGLSVFLCEMNDLASGTSSWSTKLIHGGLRYLEYYEFRLVREALIEREVIWRIASSGASPRISSGPCASCCRIIAACVRHGCSASAFSCTIISAAASACLPPGPST
jgi:glycerol-3-phosphate dehydrogenase